MKANEIKLIREALSSPIISTNRAIELRALLEIYAQDNYKPVNTPVRVMAFIKKHGNSLILKKTHPTDVSVPYVWQLFTPKSAWVCGDVPQECFDKAIAVKKDWTHLSTTDANALILAHQALKDSKAENTVQVAEVA